VVWVRSAAIRPVPIFAQLDLDTLSEVEEWLSGDEEATETRLADLFDRFERERPVLAERIGTALARTHDEVALALGYYLSLVIWLAFEKQFGALLRHVGTTELTSVEEAFALDEEIRGADPAEAVDSEDVVAMEQPHVVEFIHRHVDAAFEVHGNVVDVDAVHSVYRLVLIEVLALSYAVAPPDDVVTHTSEIHA
jgi:hypothetical protein